MLPLIAGGLAVAGQMSAQKQAEEEAKKQALAGLVDAYDASSYAAKPEMPEGPSPVNLAATGALAGLQQGKANDAAAKAGQVPDFGDDLLQGAGYLGYR